MRSVHSLARSLVELGHDVHAYTTNVDGSERLQVPTGVRCDLDGVKVHYFPLSVFRRLFHSSEMVRFLETHVGGFDMVHIHTLFLWTGYAAARIGFRMGVPYMVSPRGMLVRELIRKRGWLRKNLWLHMVEWRTLQQAGALHLTSRREYEDVLEFTKPLPQCFVIPNGVDSPDSWHLRDHRMGEGCDPAGEGAWDDLLGQRVLSWLGPEGYPVVLYLGRINWKKGIDCLIQAVAHLPGVRLILAGNDDGGYTRYLEQRVDKFGVRDRVLFTGSVDGREKKRLLESAQVLVLPSMSENFGNVVAEAMAVGCPVIVTPGVGLAETVEKSGAGLVTGGNDQAIAQAIRTILSDPQLARRMGECGKKIAQEQLSWKKIAQEMATSYQWVMDHHHGGLGADTPRFFF
ncbi:MAG TPA: glycosyltransferase [Magnetococcales bacterium]|nr:glycosyltransferase [Magnetococcales bacterium]